MGRMKQNKIIAVDTSLGTNFLISACDEATVSELRGFIQTGHFSCFPAHGSINVLALMVEYSQRQYHVTDSLLIGQIFRKSWNKIHAEVSSGSLRAASTLHSSKSAESESLAHNKTGNQCAVLDDTLLAKPAGSKSLDVDGHSNEALVHSSSPLLCGEKVLKFCNDVVPVISNSQISWINRDNFRCPLLFTEEAPYTQSHSQLNLATRVSASKEALDNGRKCRKSKCSEEILTRKRKQAEVAGQINHSSDRDEDLSPGKKSPISVKGDINTPEHKGQQCKEDALCRHEFSEEVTLIEGDAQFPEAYKKPEKSKLQSDNILSANTCMADDSIQRKHSKDPSSPNSEDFVANPGKLKTSPAVCKSLHNDTEEVGSCQENLKVLKSSLSEKEFTTMEKEAVNQAWGKARREGGFSCSKMFAEIGAEVNSHNQHEKKMDLSMGYPIQMNDHSILLVASLSAEVVPETQESEMQSQDGKNAESEEAVLQKRGLIVFEHAAMEPHSNCFRQDPVEPQEIVAQEFPFHQDMRNMNSIDVNNMTGNLALLAEKKEKSKPKPCVAMDLPSKSFCIEKNNEGKDAEILGARNDECDGQLYETGLTGGNHDTILVRKKKKRKRRKVLEIQKVSVPEDSRFVASGSKSQYIQGVVDPKNDAEKTAVLLESPTETCNHAKGGESCHMLEEQGQTQLGNADADPTEMQKQNATALNVDESNCKEFAGDETMALGMVLIDPSLEKESGEKCIEGSSKGGCETMQGELLGTKQGALTQSGATCRKKKKRRKEHFLPCPEGASGENLPKMGNERDRVPFSIKELPNVLRLIATKEGELHRKKKAKFVGEQVTKKNSKKEMIETDPNIGLMQEQGQDNATVELANRNDTEPLLKDGLVASSSTRSPLKECSQEGLVKTKPSFDVFDFESSETVNRPKENCIDTEVTSYPEANNLEKLCSVAVKLVEDDILNSSQMTTRKSSRKAVHPKRWITVLSERLTSNQMSSKKQRANKRNKPIAEGTGLPNPEPLYAEEEEAKEERSQIIIGDGRVACYAGCGRLYTKKTSAYYRHSKRCSGGDYRY